jgi:hypothetical protein
MNMNRTLATVFLLIFAALALAGCGVEEGKVTNKEFIPAHEEHYQRQQYAGEDCNTTTDMDGNTHRSCTPRYIYVDDTRWVGDAWQVTIEKCEEGKKCKSSDVDVSKSIYDRIHEGDIYNRKTKKITKQ